MCNQNRSRIPLLPSPNISATSHIASSTPAIILRRVSCILSVSFILISYVVPHRNLSLNVWILSRGSREGESRGCFFFWFLIGIAEPYTAYHSATILNHRTTPAAWILVYIPHSTLFINDSNDNQSNNAHPHKGNISISDNLASQTSLRATPCCPCEEAGTDDKEANDNRSE